jgi:hypothetical protein
MTVDLSDLTNIDAVGKEVLLEMCRRGVMLTGSGVMTRAVIEEIATQMRPQKARPGAET